jgi:DNA-binding PadR family transcriptional regulator
VFLQSEIVGAVYERFLREFMDVLIMVRLRDGEASGYDMLNHLHRDFDFSVSPGTVYSVLYSMERKGLIEARGVDRKRVYTLTPKGQKAIEAIHESSETLERLFEALLKADTSEGQAKQIRQP